MSSYINNALSGLIAAQRGLQATSSNIANAATEGYSRQRIVQVQGPATGAGALQFGTGTQVTGIERIYDQLLADQLTTARSSEQKSQIISQYASRLDGLLGNPELGLASSLQAFYAQAGRVANEPTSQVNRQQLLSQAESMAQRFRQLGGQLDSLDGEINQRLRFAVQGVNDDLQAIARLNAEIMANGSQAANSLLDQRQQLIDKVSTQLDIQTTAQTDGSTTVMLNSGQPLVLGGTALQLGVQADAADPSRLQLTYNGGGPSQLISRRISGGEIGGLLAFREQMLDPARRELGLIAVGVSTTFNAQNAQGLDLSGNLGTDLFSRFSPEVLPAADNSGAASVTVSFTDTSALRARDYSFSFDGTDWRLNDLAAGAPVSLSGAGTAADPFLADGMALVLGGAPPAAGDSFVVRPVNRAAAAMSVVMTDPAGVAAASPLRTTALVSNVGSATISSAQVSDLDNPDLLQRVRIVFNDPPTSYSLTDISGVPLAPPQAYNDGDTIAFNGWEVSVSGTPAAGDILTVDSAGSNSGDNANALQLADLFNQGFFAGGSVSLQDSSAQLTSAVGSYASRSANEMAVQTSVRQQLELNLESVAGVNLEEEAVNILRYQEAYLASSKMISVANDLFQTIINAIR